MKHGAGAAVLIALILSIVRIPQAAGQAEPIDPPIRIPKPQPVATTLEGTAIRIDLRASPPKLHVHANGTTTSVAVWPQTSIFISETSSGRGGAAGLDQVRRGDMVRITLDEHLRAMLISASHREVSGRVAWIRSGSIRLSGGQTFRLAGEPSFLLGNREVRREAIQRGVAVVLRVHPQTGEVWEVRARSRAARTPVGSLWDRWNEFLPS